MSRILRIFCMEGEAPPEPSLSSLKLTELTEFTEMQAG
jgi:hypothetical protein